MPTPPPGLEGFTPLQQMILSALGFVVAAAIWAYGFMKKPNATVTKDVIVPNINVMDGEVFRDAARTIREQMAQNEARERIIRELAAELRSQTDLFRTMVDVLKTNQEFLESIDRRMKSEYFRQREERERLARVSDREE
jgi:hypothetical protein